MPGTKRTIAYLEGKFQTGDVPTQQDFYDFFASFIHYTQISFRGEWAGTTALPVNADNVGSDVSGDILAGDQWVLTNDLVFGGSVFPAKSLAVARQNSPTTLSHWTILAPQS